MYSLLTESELKLILFAYEKDSENKIILRVNSSDDENYTYISKKGEYILWELEKRKLTEEEILKHSWLLTSQETHSLLLCFGSQNRLTISSLFNQECYSGSWRLEHGILKIFFCYREHNYAIDVIANNNRLIHSAVQIVDDFSIDVLKVVPISNAKYGHSLIE